jgi:hypothetical protein
MSSSDVLYRKQEVRASTGTEFDSSVGANDRVRSMRVVDFRLGQMCVDLSQARSWC